jgi:hypothetical protein
MDIYKGSYICVLSAQLFLVAAICNYNWCNYFESSIIFLVYITSIYYHKNPTILNKIIDEYMARITVIVSISSSLYYYNIFPSIFTSIMAYMYFNAPKFQMNSHISNLYHALCVHIPCFLGLMSLIYNTNIEI